MLLRPIIELITPVSCLSCDQEGALLCAGCAATVTMPVPTCFVCGRLTETERACGACRSELALDGAAVGAHYDEVVRELILKLKFGRARAAVDPATGLLLRAVPADLISRLDGVTSVPVAPDRHRERGYNQSELLARAVARRLNLPYRSLLRRRGSVHQLGAGRHERFAQVQEAFEAIVEAPGHWLIIDDVITTGATLNACAAALRGSGAKRVTAAVVAGQHG